MNLYTLTAGQYTLDGRFRINYKGKKLSRLEKNWVVKSLKNSKFLFIAIPNKI